MRLDDDTVIPWIAIAFYRLAQGSLASDASRLGEGSRHSRGHRNVEHHAEPKVSLSQPGRISSLPGPISWTTAKPEI